MKGSEIIVESAGRIVRGLIEGERALHGLGLREAFAVMVGPASASGRPPRYETLMAPRLRAYLRYVLATDESGSLFFGLLGADTVRRKLADIRLGLEIAPLPDHSGRSGQGTAGGGLTFALPRFVQPAPGSRSLAVALAGGGRLEAAGAPDGAIREVKLNGRPVSLEGVEGWPLQYDLVKTFAAWLRDQAYGPARPLRTMAGDRLDRLLQTLVERCAELMRLLEPPAEERQSLAALLDSESDRRLPERAGLPALGQSFGLRYGFTRLSSRILANLDEAGRLVTGEDDRRGEAQQVDIEADLAPGESGAGLDLRFKIPDFLVDGAPYHDRFVEALRGPEGAEVLHEGGVRRELGLGLAIWRRFLDQPEVAREAVLLRAIQASDARKERNVVLLEGPAAGTTGAGLLRLLFEARFEVTSFPDVAVKRLRSADLLAWQQDQGAWRSVRERRNLADYLLRNLGLLASWQSRMVEPRMVEPKT